MSRVLGLDFGLKRIGAAVSDPRRQIATPLEVYERQSPEQDARHYQKLVREDDIDRIVIGLPIHTRGEESILSRAAREWGAWLASQTGTRVLFFDERYTSVEADEVLRSAGIRARERQSKRDMIAAQILLQHYLDAGSPDEDSAALPLDDDDQDERVPPS
jgi:putative Holliday junction resolvase